MKIRILVRGGTSNLRLMYTGPKNFRTWKSLAFLKIELTKTCGLKVSEQEKSGMSLEITDKNM